jgi:hypothetical protein
MYAVRGSPLRDIFNLIITFRGLITILISYLPIIHRQLLPPHMCISIMWHLLRLGTSTVSSLVAVILMSVCVTHHYNTALLSCTHYFHFTAHLFHLHSRTRLWLMRLIFTWELHSTLYGQSHSGNFLCVPTHVLLSAWAGQFAVNLKANNGWWSREGEARRYTSSPSLCHVTICNDKSTTCVVC